MTVELSTIHIGMMAAADSGAFVDVSLSLLAVAGVETGLGRRSLWWSLSWSFLESRFSSAIPSVDDMVMEDKCFGYGMSVVLGGWRGTHSVVIPTGDQEEYKRTAIEKKKGRIAGVNTRLC